MVSTYLGLWCVMGNGSLLRTIKSILKNMHQFKSDKKTMPIKSKWARRVLYKHV